MVHRIHMTSQYFSPFILSLAIASTPCVAAPTAHPSPWFGADLSYVNEMKACGANYASDGETDPYRIFASAGTNLVRVRLWNNPTWTRFSDLTDVTSTIAAAKSAGMKVLLDFHYSDDWADGDTQIVPAAWAALTEDQQVAALYAYTRDTLNTLKAKGLMPDMVQIGNETNREIMMPASQTGKSAPSAPIHWTRNARLFNAGIKAVRDASADSAIKPGIMIHIAQPENVEAWFAEATAAGVTGYDMIGMSYYRKWSKYGLPDLAETIRRVHSRFDKDVMIVETAYPFTDETADAAPNLLGSDSALPGYPVTPQGQVRYMHDLMQLTLDAGGSGVVYWEPAWVSTKCHTRWSQGSNWENAAFFDFEGRGLPALKWPKLSYVLPVEVTFTVADHGQPAQYLMGDFTGGVVVAMHRSTEGFVYSTWLRPASDILAATSGTAASLVTDEAQKIRLGSAASVVRLTSSH